MKFSINLSGKTLYTFMRECGYAPAFAPRKPAAAGGGGQESAFHRFLAGRSYPKFHAYCAPAQDAKTAIINLHLDQKQASYKGSHAHSAEHEGPLLDEEAARIKALSR
ncbi:MAG: hypothetical protein A2940_01985 [Candidatus Wildermuthbacteria bacterium RIFCSPLOWO2_01_FULL_48_29]|uniref:Uncharacterized protein n=2 Tax=Candidatus Wildermuthiibacteriota TaxID=1817923 RepID=A0A1G2RMV3_9BACT|nr:MAG: hypothetical protein A2843_00285 [Candidatus Wildermuthbacteria bacterium RIFCSPHIGHO2_01_FULL_48_27b]OHA74195.1 MAG: hypothetical protein A2940_01985 [Candidatus Wildermuthbacteria bacterium RIFCSPLOWO2_01_FULL_48_29]